MQELYKGSFQFQHLTPSLPGHFKWTLVSSVTSQLHTLPGDWARELFKPLKDAAGLLVCIEKKIGCLGFQVFCGWHRKRNKFQAFLVCGISFRLPGPGPQPLDGILWLKFLLEPRLESESFEPLIDFLPFWVQNIWTKNNKIVNGYGPGPGNLRQNGLKPSPLLTSPTKIPNPQIFSL